MYICIKCPFGKVGEVRWTLDQKAHGGRLDVASDGRCGRPLKWVFLISTNALRYCWVCWFLVLLHWLLLCALRVQGPWPRVALCGCFYYATAAGCGSRGIFISATAADLLAWLLPFSHLRARGHACWGSLLWLVHIAGLFWRVTRATGNLSLSKSLSGICHGTFWLCAGRLYVSKE